MSDTDTGNGLQVTTQVTKEDVESMIEQMQAKITASLTDYLSKMEPSGTATSSKLVDTGKSVKLQEDLEGYYDPEAYREEQEGLPYPMNHSVPVRSASRPAVPLFSTVTLSKQILEPMFSKEQIRKMIQGEVQASQTGLKGYFGLDLDSFSIVPGITLPENFKAPKFTLYDGNSNAQEHLMMYCKKMAPYAANDDLMIYTFQDSLTGPALKWFGYLDKSCTQSWKSLAEAFARHYAFNERLAMTKEELRKMGRKHHESIREYAKRWTIAAGQVRPTLSDGELAEEFLKTLEPEHQEKLASHIDYDIFQMVRAIERMEKMSQGTKASEISRGMRNDLEKPDDFVNALSMPMNPRKRDSSFSPKIPFNPHPHYLAPHFQHQQSYFPASSFPSQQSYLPVPQAQVYPGYHPLASLNSPTYQPSGLSVSHPNEARSSRRHPRRTFRHFDPIQVSYLEMYQQLLARGMIVPEPVNLSPNTAAKSYNTGVSCVFHSGQMGHDIENFIPLKHRIQDMIEAGQLNLENRPNNTNHDAPMTGAILNDDYLENPEKILSERVGPSGSFAESGCAKPLKKGRDGSFRVVPEDLEPPALPYLSHGKPLRNWTASGYPEKPSME